MELALLESLEEGIKKRSFPRGSVIRNLPTSSGDPDSIPEWGRSFGGGNGNPLKYSCLEKAMDREAWQATVYEVTKSWT